MTEAELREACGLGPNDLISSNLGFLDILCVRHDVVTIGVVASGNTITESTESVIAKLKGEHCDRKKEVRHNQVENH
jgi:hypothetical protein